MSEFQSMLLSLGLGLVVITGAGRFQDRALRRRHRALAAWTAQRGWRYQAARVRRLLPAGALPFVPFDDEQLVAPALLLDGPHGDARAAVACYARSMWKKDDIRFLLLLSRQWQASRPLVEDRQLTADGPVRLQAGVDGPEGAVLTPEVRRGLEAVGGTAQAYVLPHAVALTVQLAAEPDVLDRALEAAVALADAADATGA